jgi:hypothetical protein
MCPGETTAELANAVGRVHWQLGPDGQASAQRDGRGLLLRLTEGSIEVEVDPGDDPEQVTVAAGEVRVVVHGTKFRVEHLQETVNVTVHEGVVAVSAPAVPNPVRLAAPSSTTFASKKEGARQRDSGATPASPLLPVEPSIGDVENAVARLQQAAQGCFERHTAAASGVQVTARTNVVLAVQPNGTATARAFDPPLSPAVQGCTRAALSAIRLAPSQRGIEVTRALDLGR